MRVELRTGGENERGTGRGADLTDMRLVGKS
jgi:hypothetical protein